MSWKNGLLLLLSIHPMKTLAGQSLKKRRLECLNSSEHRYTLQYVSLYIWSWCDVLLHISFKTPSSYTSDKNFRLKLCAKGDFLSYLIATHIFLLSKDLFFYKNFILRWWKSATKYFARTDYNLHYNVHTLKKYLCVKKVRIEFCWESERKLNESCQKNFFADHHEQ